MMLDSVDDRTTSDGSNGHTYMSGLVTSVYTRLKGIKFYKQQQQQQ